MKNPIVKIDHEEYGLQATEAKKIESAFVPMLEKMTELEDAFNEVIVKDLIPETCAEARRLRLDYVKVRTATAAIHKKAKAYYLAGGRFVDGWKNAQLFAAQEKEERLKEIEEHFERIEAEKKRELGEKREAQIAPYGDFEGTDFSEMDEAVWTNFLSGAKSAYEQRIAAEKKAEEERIAAEKAERERIQKQAEENARLKAEAEKREKEIAAERKRVEQERMKAEAKAKKEREAAEAKARAEAEKREKAEAELEAKRKAEREAEEARLAAEEAEKAKGESERFTDFLNGMKALSERYSFRSDRYAEAHARIEQVLNDVHENESKMVAA